MTITDLNLNFDQGSYKADRDAFIKPLENLPLMTGQKGWILDDGKGNPNYGGITVTVHSIDAREGLRHDLASWRALLGSSFPACPIT